MNCLDEAKGHNPTTKEGVLRAIEEGESASWERAQACSLIAFEQDHDDLDSSDSVKETHRAIFYARGYSAMRDVVSAQPYDQLPSSLIADFHNVGVGFDEWWEDHFSGSESEQRTPTERLLPIERVTQSEHGVELEKFLGCSNLDDFVETAESLKERNVQPHEDGYYHAYVSDEVWSELWSESRLFTPQNHYLRDHSLVRAPGFLATYENIKFFLASGT